MLKKALIASAVLAASTGLAFANGGILPPAPQCVHNVYVGVGVSRDFVSFDTEQAFFAQDFLGDTVVRADQIDLGDDGWDGEIFAGIGWTFWDHYYLAGEIFGSLSNADAEYQSTSAFADPVFGFGTDFHVQKEIELKGSYGIALIPGVKISDSTMLYGRVGWIRSRFDVDDHFLIPGVIQINHDFDETENGIQLGLGLETMITNNVSTRLEYDWNRYSDLEGRAVNNDLQPFFTAASAIKVDHPTVNQAKLEVAYHFMEA